MINSLTFAAIVVIVIWVIIIGIFLFVSRKQPDIAGQIDDIQNTLTQLDSEENER